MLTGRPFTSLPEEGLESDGVAGCGKTSAAYVAALELGCSDFATERIDRRACTVADLRDLSGRMMLYGPGGKGPSVFHHR